MWSWVSLCHPQQVYSDSSSNRPFLESSVEPDIEVFFEIDVLNIRELVAGLADSPSVDVVVVVFRFVLVLLQGENDVILCHYRVLDLSCILGREGGYTGSQTKRAICQ